MTNIVCETMTETTSNTIFEKSKKKIIKVKKPKILLEDIPEDENGFSTRKFKIFSSIISLIADTTDEVNFNISEEGLTIQCMDGGHVSYLLCDLPKEFFDNFNCKEPRSIGINMKSLTKIFNMAKINVGLTIIFKQDFIDFYIKSPTIDKQYSMRQMILDQEDLTIPDMEWDYVVNLPSNDFYTATHEMQDMGESCELKIKNKALQFKSEGIVGLVKIKITPPELINNTEDKFFKVGFSSKYLFHYAKARYLSDNIKLEIKKQCPIKMTYDIGDGGMIYNFVAPKIE